MHTAVAEITYNDATRVALIQIRIFADDLYGAVAESGVPDSTPRSISRYLNRKFALADQEGSTLPLQWLAAERVGDVLLLRLTAMVPRGLSGVRVTATMLCEKFADQVNIVRAAYGAHTSTLLFTRGDPAKLLP